MAKKTSATHEPNPKVGKGAPSTISHLPFSEIRNDSLIMKDGTLRAVLLVSSVNFFLKSEDEQQAIIQGYNQLLNTFDFPVQIVVQSRQFDISHYIEALEKKEKTQTNDLLRLQMTDYRQFISELVGLGQIMDKKFYVVVPYNPASDSKRGFFKQIGSVFTAASEVSLHEEQFLKRKHFLDQRVDTLMGAFTSMGLNSARLDTQALIEMLYTMYNPDIVRQEKMVETEKIQFEE